MKLKEMERETEASEMNRSRIVSPQEWEAARQQLLVKEKELTRARDSLAAERRRMPWAAVEKEYVFEGPDGKASLLDLFEGRRQLIVGHFMFDPTWEDGCPSCTAGADEIEDGLLEHLHTRDTSFTYVSRAPLPKIERYKAKRGWTFAWYSSYDNEFNYDFQVTLDPSVAPVEYNYRTAAEYEQMGTPFFDGEQPPLEERCPTSPAEETAPVSNVCSANLSAWRRPLGPPSCTPTSTRSTRRSS